MASKQQKTQKHTAGGQDVGCTRQHIQHKVDTRDAKGRTQMDVGEELTDPGGKQSQEFMDDRTKVQTIIRRAHPKLRSQLNLNEEFLIELKATDQEVISEEEHDEIRTKTGAKRIDHLLELIKLKSTGAYFSFMEVLERKDGDLYKIVKNVQDTIFTGVFLENPHSNFNLEECQDELQKFYLDELSKVQLLPWGQGPDDIADMEAIFVDLELVKKETAISSKESTILDSNEKLVDLKTTRGQRLNRVLVQGEGGSGKSTLLANIAYKWALQLENPQSPLSQYQLVFILGMHEIQEKNATFIDLIFQQILKVDSKVSPEGLKDYIISHAKDVLLLFDGLDEDSSSTLSNKSGEVTQVLHNRKLRDSCVILTSRPHKVDDLGDFKKKYVHVNLTGFSQKNIKCYITKIIQNNVKIERLLEKLRQEPHLMAMAATPVLLLMICLLWKDQCSLPDTMTQLYQETINYLWRRYQKKNGLKITSESQEKNMDPDLATLLYKLGKMALDGIAPLQETEERVMFTDRDIGEDTSILGCKVGIISRERLRSKLNVVSSVTFLHKTFQEFSAAMYLAKLYEIDIPEFDRYLQKLHYLDKENILRMKHTLCTKPGVLEFCCGTWPEIAPVVMKHNASLVCQCYTYHGVYNLPHIHMSLGLRCVFESQLTHKECLNYHQIYSNLSHVSLRISHEDIASILYQLKLISSQSVSNNHLFFPLLGELQITIGFTPWLHRLLKYTPNLVTLMINLGTANIHTSDLIPLYEALTGLHHLRYLYMEGHRTRIYSRDISSMLRMMLSHTKENMFATFGMKGFQFDCKLMAEFLISNQSLIHLYLQAPENLNEQTTVTEILSILPNLKKLKRLELRGYKIRSDIMNLKPIISQLEDLYLGVNQLDEKHMIELFSFLNMGHKLRTLYLNGNSITVASMTSLVQCLPGDFYALGLEETDLNDETACILASRLKVGSTIRILCLYGNPDIGTIGRDVLQGLHMKIYWDTRIWVGKSFYSMN